MLFVQVQEVWDRDVHLIVAPNKGSPTLLLLLLDSFRVLVVFNGLLCGVRDTLKNLLVVAPNHALFHVLEGENCLELPRSYLYGLANFRHNHGLHCLLLFIF